MLTTVYTFSSYHLSSSERTAVGCICDTIVYISQCFSPIVPYDNSFHNEQQQQQHNNAAVDSNSIDIRATWRNSNHTANDIHTQQQQQQYSSTGNNAVVQSWTSMVTQFGRHRDVMKPDSSSSNTTARNRRSSTGTMLITAGTTANISHQYHQQLGIIQQQPLQQQQQQQQQYEHIADDFDAGFDNEHTSAMSTLSHSESPQHAGSIVTAVADTAAVSTALRQASVSSIGNSCPATAANASTTATAARSNVASGSNIVSSNTQQQQQQQQQRRDQRVVYICAAVLQDYETVLHPIGIQLQMIIHSTWGDGYYCGLNSIQIYSSSSNDGKHVKQLELQGSQVAFMYNDCFEFVLCTTNLLYAAHGRCSTSCRGQLNVLSVTSRLNDGILLFACLLCAVC
jgi:Domain of unknown function (DUF4457)